MLASAAMKTIPMLALIAALAVGCKKKDAAKTPEGTPPAQADAAPPPVDAAPPPVDAAPPPVDAAQQLGNAMPDDWFTTGCPKVLERIGQCAADKAFLAALTAGADKADKKTILGRAADAKRFAKDAKGICGELPSVSYEDEGFLAGNWSALAAPETLADCAKLGAAVKDAGGLYGGSVDE